MDTTPSISVVLPCYNEAGNIPMILSRFRDAIGTREGIEVILVDNGSGDQSPAVLRTETEKPDREFVRVVTVPVNRGYGFGIMSGLRQARGEVLAWTHADLQTDPADVLSAHALFAEQKVQTATFLKGKRIARNPFDSLFTFGMSLVCSIALRERLFDVNAQPKMFHRSFLECMKNPPDDFSLDLYALYLARTKGMNVLEYPVSFARRRYGQAKGGGTMRGKMKLIRRTWAYIFALRRNLRLGRSLAE